MNDLYLDPANCHVLWLWEIDGDAMLAIFLILGDRYRRPVGDLPNFGDLFAKVFWRLSFRLRNSLNWRANQTKAI